MSCCAPLREPPATDPDAIAPARVIDWHVRSPPRRDERLCHWPVFPESLASPARALPVAAEASSPRVMLVVDEPRPAARLHSTWNVRLAASNMTILYCCPRSPPLGPSAARSAGQPYGWAAPPASPPCPHNGALAPCSVLRAPCALAGVGGWRAGGERRCSRWQVDEVHAWCGRACVVARARLNSPVVPFTCRHDLVMIMIVHARGRQSTMSRPWADHNAVPRGVCRTNVRHDCLSQRERLAALIEVCVKACLQ